MALVVGHHYVAVLEHPNFNGRPVYAITCGAFAKNQIGVLQHPNFNGRPVRAFATCFEGQHLEDWRVVAVPQRVFFNGRWVYGFACCPAGGSGSYGGSGSPSGSVAGSESGSVVSGIASGSPSGVSGSGIASGTSGSGVQSGVQSGTSGQSGSGTLINTACSCSPLPSTLYSTVSGTGCAADGSYALNYGVGAGSYDSSLGQGIYWWAFKDTMPGGGLTERCAFLYLFQCDGTGKWFFAARQNPLYPAGFFANVCSINEGTGDAVVACDPFSFTGSSSVQPYEFYTCGCDTSATAHLQVYE